MILTILPLNTGPVCGSAGKWAYEVLISSQGLMQIGWCTLSCRFNQEVCVPSDACWFCDLMRWNIRHVSVFRVGQFCAESDVFVFRRELETLQTRMLTMETGSESGT